MAEREGRGALLARAEAAYLQAVELRPLHPGARNNLGLLYLNGGRLAAAEVQFRTLLKVSPDIAPARLNLGRLLLQQNRWQEAEAEYEAALRYGDTGGIAQGFRGNIAYRYRSDAERALRYYEQAIALAVEPEASYLVGRGAALVVLNKYSEAEVAYLAALKADARHVDAWYNLGNLYRRLEDESRASEAYGRVVQIDTDPRLTEMAQLKLDQTAP